MKSRYQQEPRALRTLVTAAALALSFGAAQGASYTSPALVNDFSGSGSCSAAQCGDSDKTYRIVTEQLGWSRFGSTNNPVPGLLLTIDPNFAGKYQVDSITLAIKQRWGLSATTAWDFLVGDGAGGPTNTYHLQTNNYSVESFTIDAGDASFARALNGGLMFRLVENTSGTQDNLWLFNAKAYVNYSDKLAPPVPEPAEWSMLLGGLLVVGFIAARRKQMLS
jgi:hypothetical protein